MNNVDFQKLYIMVRRNLKPRVCVYCGFMIKKGDYYVKVGTRCYHLKCFIQYFNKSELKEVIKRIVEMKISKTCPSSKDFFRNLLLKGL